MGGSNLTTSTTVALKASRFTKISWTEYTQKFRIFQARRLRHRRASLLAFLLLPLWRVFFFLLPCLRSLALRRPRDLRSEQEKEKGLSWQFWLRKGGADDDERGAAASLAALRLERRRIKNSFRRYKPARW